MVCELRRSRQREVGVRSTTVARAGVFVGLLDRSAPGCAAEGHNFD